jgi:hypothetical protein
VGENVGLRIHLAERLDNLFATPHADEPVVDDCDPHQMLSFESLPPGSRSTLEGLLSTGATPLEICRIA